MPFQPGQSGNPAGRRREVSEVRELARKHTTAAIEALVKSLEDPKQRVAAANALLDRGYGKPVQEITGADGGPLLGSLEVRYVKPGDATSADAG